MQEQFDRNTDQSPNSPEANLSLDAANNVSKNYSDQLANFSSETVTWLDSNPAGKNLQSFQNYYNQILALRTNAESNLGNISAQAKAMGIREDVSKIASQNFQEIYERGLGWVLRRIPEGALIVEITEMPRTAGRRCQEIIQEIESTEQDPEKAAALLQAQAEKLEIELSDRIREKETLFNLKVQNLDVREPIQRAIAPKLAELNLLKTFQKREIGLEEARKEIDERYEADKKHIEEKLKELETRHAPEKTTNRAQEIADQMLASLEMDLGYLSQERIDSPFRNLESLAAGDTAQNLQTARAQLEKGLAAYQLNKVATALEDLRKMGDLVRLPQFQQPFKNLQTALEIKGPDGQPLIKDQNKKTEILKTIAELSQAPEAAPYTTSASSQPRSSESRSKLEEQFEKRSADLRAEQARKVNEMKEQQRKQELDSIKQSLENDIKGLRESSASILASVPRMLELTKGIILSKISLQQTVDHKAELAKQKTSSLNSMNQTLANLKTLRQKYPLRVNLVDEITIKQLADEYETNIINIRNDFETKLDAMILAAQREIERKLTGK